MTKIILISLLLLLNISAVRANTQTVAYDYVRIICLNHGTASAYLVKEDDKYFYLYAKPYTTLSSSTQVNIRFDKKVCVKQLTGQSIQIITTTEKKQ